MGPVLQASLRDAGSSWATGTVDWKSTATLKHRYAVPSRPSPFTCSQLTYENLCFCRVFEKSPGKSGYRGD
jgi:hypothetical protein